MGGSEQHLISRFNANSYPIQDPIIPPPRPTDPISKSTGSELPSRRNHVSDPPSPAPNAAPDKNITSRSSLDEVSVKK